MGEGGGGLWYPLVIYEIAILVDFNTLNTFVVHFAQSLFYQRFAVLPEWDVCFITRGQLYFNHFRVQTKPASLYDLSVQKWFTIIFKFAACTENWIKDKHTSSMLVLPNTG